MRAPASAFRGKDGVRSGAVRLLARSTHAVEAVGARAALGAMADPHSLPFSLLESLATIGGRSPHDEAARALSSLVREVEQLEPSEISALSESAERTGALTRICGELLAAPTAHQNALAILANLTTAEVNPRAGDAKEVMKANDSIAVVVRHLFSEYVQTAALACAVCQNVCANDAEVVGTLQQLRAPERLRELAQCDIATIASAANGCLANLTNFWAHAGAIAAQTAPRAWHRAATRLQVCAPHARPQMHARNGGLGLLHTQGACLGRAPPPLPTATSFSQRPGPTCRSSAAVPLPPISPAQFQYIRHMTRLQFRYIRHQKRKSRQSLAQAAADADAKLTEAVEAVMEERAQEMAAAETGRQQSVHALAAVERERDGALATAATLEKRLRGMAVMASHAPPPSEAPLPPPPAVLEAARAEGREAARAEMHAQHEKHEKALAGAWARGGAALEAAKLEHEAIRRASDDTAARELAQAVESARAEAAEASAAALREATAILEQQHAAAMADVRSRAAAAADQAKADLQAAVAEAQARAETAMSAAVAAALATAQDEAVEKQAAAVAAARSEALGNQRAAMDAAVAAEAERWQQQESKAADEVRVATEQQRGLLSAAESELAQLKATLAAVKSEAALAVEAVTLRMIDAVATARAEAAETMELALVRVRAEAAELAAVAMVASKAELAQVVKERAAKAAEAAAAALEAEAAEARVRAAEAKAAERTASASASSAQAERTRAQLAEVQSQHASAVAAADASASAAAMETERILTSKSALEAQCNKHSVALEARTREKSELSARVAAMREEAEHYRHENARLTAELADALNRAPAARPAGPPRSHEPPDGVVTPPARAQPSSARCEHAPASAPMPMPGGRVRPRSAEYAPAQSAAQSPSPSRSAFGSWNTPSPHSTAASGHAARVQSPTADMEGPIIEEAGMETAWPADALADAASTGEGDRQSTGEASAARGAAASSTAPQVRQTRQSLRQLHEALRHSSSSSCLVPPPHSASSSSSSSSGTLVPSASVAAIVPPGAPRIPARPRVDGALGSSMVLGRVVVTDELSQLPPSASLPQLGVVRRRSASRQGGGVLHSP